MVKLEWGKIGLGIKMIGIRIGMIRIGIIGI